MTDDNSQLYCGINRSTFTATGPNSRWFSGVRLIAPAVILALPFPPEVRREPMKGVSYPLCK